MATRSRKRRGGTSRASAVRKSFNDAQKTIGAYAKKGGKQVNTAITSFLSRFETAHLLDALKKKTGMSGRGGTRRRRSNAKRSSARGRRATTRSRTTRRAAAARAKGAGRKRSRR
jgi:hypothetical protein